MRRYAVWLFFENRSWAIWPVTPLATLLISEVKLQVSGRGALAAVSKQEWHFVPAHLRVSSTQNSALLTLATREIVVRKCSACCS